MKHLNKTIKHHTIKSWHLFTTGLGIYVIALIASAPAMLINTPLQKFSGGQLHLVEAQGTLWSGQGKIEISDTTEHVTWHWQPERLLHAQLAYQVKLGSDSTPPFPLTFSWSQVELANADIQLPAELLGHGLPKLAALGLSGDVQIHITSLSITPKGTKGNATLAWRAAASTLTPVSPLGDYELYIEGRGPVIHSTLRTLQGPLQLDGQGSWGNGDKSGFLATARITAPFQSQLAPFLRLIAVEHSDGSFELQVN